MVTIVIHASIQYAIRGGVNLPIPIRLISTVAESYNLRVECKKEIEL